MLEQSPEDRFSDGWVRPAESSSTSQTNVLTCNCPLEVEQVVHRVTLVLLTVVMRGSSDTTEGVADPEDTPAEIPQVAPTSKPTTLTPLQACK